MFLQGFTKFYQVLPSFSHFLSFFSLAVHLLCWYWDELGFYRVFTGFWVGFTGLDYVLLCFYRVKRSYLFLLGFIGFYWVLLGFTGLDYVLLCFYRVLPSFIKFYLVSLSFSLFFFIGCALTVLVLGLTGFLLNFT